MKKYSLLVFDWDGTLVNSAELAIKALQQTAKQLGYPVPTAEDAAKHCGVYLDDVLRELFPQENLHTLQDIFHQYFNEEKLATNFFPGTLDTLKYLKQQGFLLAVATNRTNAKLKKALNIANLQNFFHATRCAEDVPPKPAPDMLLTLLEELHVSAQDTLMIGDTIWDMQCANNAKVDALAIYQQDNSQEQLAIYNPIGFIKDIQELKHMLKYQLGT